jgi:hypothetical protein
MKRISWAKTLLGVIFCTMLVCCTGFCQTPGQLNVADLAVGTGSAGGVGAFQIWRNSGHGYTWIGNLTTSDGATSACAADVTWRIYGAISTTSGSFPERFAIASPHAVATTASPNTADLDVRSISIDSFGHLYVGGTTDITQYVDTAINHTAPPAEPQTLQSNGSFSVTGGAPYLDLQDDNHLVFTNGGAKILQLSNLSPWPSVASVVTLIDTSSTIKGTFFGIKVIPPWATKAGSILVANGKTIARFDPPFTPTSQPAMTYSVGGNQVFTSVAIDSNGTSLWAGESGGTFYRIRISDGLVETPKGGNALNISTGGGGTMGGMCVLGGTGAAQAHAAGPFLAALSPTTTNTAKFPIPPSNGNAFKATLVNLNQPVNAVLYSVDFNPPINLQGNGISDPTGDPLTGSLQCAKDSVSLNQCEAYKLELYNSSNVSTQCTGTGSPCDYLDLTASLLNYNPLAPIDPKFYGEMATNETIWISPIGDIKLGGGGSTVHSIQEQTQAAVINCGTPFVNPKGGTATAKAGSNFNLTVQAIRQGGSCKNGPFVTNLQLRLTMVLQTTGTSPQQFGVSVTNSSFTVPATGCIAGLPPAGTPLSQVTLCDGGFNLSTGGNDTYNLGIKLPSQPATWILTVIDDSGQLAAGSVTVTAN